MEGKKEMPMSKRKFMSTTLLVACPFAELAFAVAPAIEDRTLPTPDNLAATSLVETKHPRIATLAKEISGSAGSDRAAAVLLHDWVHDQIAFGIPPGFYETTATEVLDAKVGYCNTKVTLFSALLRARGIPTRMRMMDLSAQVLHGLFDPGTPYVDHAVTEVFLEGRWIGVDSYVVDKPLAIAAAKKLTASNSKAGFGVHQDGKPDWDGLTNNFIQCLDNKSISGYVLKDHGLFNDIMNFYQKTAEPRNRKTVVSGLITRFGSSYLNQRIQAMRMG
jgi:transglutaminase-like putative cysteine protease